jgi:hypothetical protein
MSIIFLNWLSALAALFAALFWYRASIVSVSPTSPVASGSGMVSAQITVSNGTAIEDPFATAHLSAKWNAHAAKAAAIAAFLQGVATLTPLIR